MDGSVVFKTEVSAARLPGSIKPPPIQLMKERFPEIAGYQFLEAASRSGIDVLLGLDNMEFQHIPSEEYFGPGKPIVAHTLFGPTVIYSPLSAGRDVSSSDRGATCLIDQDTLAIGGGHLRKGE